MISSVRQEDFEKIFKQHLKIETYSKSIDSLFSPRMRSKINYKPYYQRNYVWDNNKASYFIESILLGTEIPPLIFFNNNTEIEVIDGRQRFETIQRYMENKFALSEKGLTVLKQLKKKSFDDLAKKDKIIIESFLDAKIRIIEFALVNEPPLDKFLEDRVKKEIFSRYNTGITPLKKAEIDNAVYDVDSLSSTFKTVLKDEKKLHNAIFETFLKPKSSRQEEPKLEQSMSFIRRFLILPKFPIFSFARGHSRTDTLKKLYEYYSDTLEDEEIVVQGFISKLRFIALIKEYADSKNLLSNRLAFECFLWGLSVMEMEEIDLKYNDELKKEIAEYISSNIDNYNEQDSHYYKPVIDRYVTTANFFQEKFHLNLNVYLNSNSKKRDELKTLRKSTDTLTKLSELESLRLNKPEPSRNSIEDIRRVMQRRRFLVRPSYQRSEVVNVTKASAIIESLLLGIVLPPVFIFKREDGVSEVIDGQQRILTILGYIGSEYIDENNETLFSKNHKFNLRNPRILNEIDGLKFEQLPEEQRNKILDFQLYVVEIEENKNPNFDPIDLFIRLNDKPYPIREHSFEMWNSWVDFEIIDIIKQLVQKHYSWFHLKYVERSNDRDRMENEELISALAFLFHYKDSQDLSKYLYIYQKDVRLSSQIGKKDYISQVFTNVTENINAKNDFIENLKSVEGFIRKLKYILLDQDKTKDDLPDYLNTELNMLIRGNRATKYSRRSMQDFYFLWFILKDLNLEMVRYHRLEIKKELKSIFTFIKELPTEYSFENKGLYEFNNFVNRFNTKYQKAERKLRLTEEEKAAMIKSQGNKSMISDVPIFLGDDIEIDHTIPIAIGGEDKKENMSAVHKDENRKKGVNL